MSTAHFKAWSLLGILLIMALALAPLLLAARSADASSTTYKNGSLKPRAKLTAIATSTSIVTATTTPNPPAKAQEFGSWIWASPASMSEAEMSSRISSASAAGVNTLYVSVDDYIDISLMPSGADKDSRKASYFSALEKFIYIANSSGISVDAEAGDRDWAEASGKYKALLITDMVNEYNASHAYRIRALNYDVEPYLLGAFDTDRAGVLARYVQLIDETISRLGPSSTQLVITIPHFYDRLHTDIPLITYAGVTTDTYNQLLRVMDKRAGGKIIIMAYRNFSEGANGTLDITNIEMQDAASRNTQVIVAQETSNISPSTLTFYGLTKSYIQSQLDIVRSNYNSSSSYGGVAVHYLDTYLLLK